MNEEITDLQKSSLQMVVNDAKQRILFYYGDVLDAQNIQMVKETLDNCTYGFDLDYPATAYYELSTINVTRHFLNIKNYEQQVGVMIHEMSHAISIINMFNSEVRKNRYLDFYKLIEEGLADINSELIMNYYYDKKMPRINYEPYRFNSFSCGYPYERDIIKSILAIMEMQGIDNKMLKEYYFGNKEKVYEYILQIGGDKMFDLVRLSSTDNDNVVVDARREMFHTLEKNWGKAISNIASHKIYKKPGYNNVYYKENYLINQVHYTYCVDNIINQLNINIDDIKTEDIQKLYNQSNGMIEKAVNGSFVPSTIDRIIKSWFNNCKINEINLIKKIIPNIYTIADGEYYELLIKKYLKQNKVSELSVNDIAIIMGEIDYSDIFDESMEELDFYSLKNGYSSILIFFQEIYSKMNDDQKNALQSNYGKFFEYAELILKKGAIYNKILKTYNISKLEDLDGYKIFDLLENHEDLVNEINEAQVNSIINYLVKTWINNYIGEPEYLFEIFPSALYNSELLNCLKKTYGYDNKGIDQMINRIIEKKNKKSEK